MDEKLTNNNENTEIISNLINNIQSKLNNESITEEHIDQTHTNTDSFTNSDDNKNKSFDISSIFNILNNYKADNNKDGFNLNDIDPMLFSKIQKIVLNLGKQDPKKDLLNSLKPFLRKSRQDKISEYITILTLIKAFEAFKDKGSDENE